VYCQGAGGLLVRKVNGDYQNVVGFPATAFMMFLETLLEEEEDFLAV
jgi:septum formation protein